MSLVFYPKSHRYKLDGEWVRGVTGLIGGGLPKPSLIKWAPKLVADHIIDNWEDVQAAYRHNPEALRWDLRKLPEKKRDDAGVRGTEIHDLAEQIIHGHDVEVPDRLLPFVQGYVKWLDDWKVEPILTEQSVGSRAHQYAGRVDCIAKVGALGGRILGCDWKTSTNVYGSTALQVGAYARAEFTVSDDDPETELPIPDVDGNLVVHITEEGTFAHWLAQSPAEIDEAFQDFLAVAAVARRIDRIEGKWDPKLRKAMGSYLSDPIDINELRTA